MSKIPFDYDYGDSVWVIRRETVVNTVELEPGLFEVITEAGSYLSEDPDLVAIYPDPNE